MVRHVKATSATEEDIQFLIDETQSDRNLVLAALRDNGVEV